MPFLHTFYFILTFILFFFGSSTHICKKAMQQEYVGGEYANFSG